LCANFCAPTRATRALFVLGAAQLTQGHVDDAITTLENAVRIKHDAEIDTIFTFLAPLFGVAAGHFVLNDPLTPALRPGGGCGRGRHPPRQPASVTLYRGSPTPRRIRGLPRCIYLRY
jgi:hypothetical protein